MNSNKLIGVALLGAAAWLWFRGKKDAAKASQPTNAFGAPLDAQKPAVFGFNTSRLDPYKTRQATNGTANGGKASPGISLDLNDLFRSVAGLFKRSGPSETEPTYRGAAGIPGFPQGADEGTGEGGPSVFDEAYVTYETPLDQGFDYEPSIEDFGIGNYGIGETVQV